MIEGLLSAFADSVSVLEPLTQLFLRSGHSLAAPLGVASAAAFAGLAALVLRRRDVE